MNIPIHKRKFYSFISHAYIDKKIVDEMEAWLTSRAGIPIWYDAYFHQSGTKLVLELENILEQCRSMIILLSKQSIESGWVREEFDSSRSQQEKYKDLFRVILIKVEECEVPAFLETTRLIDMSKKGFDLNAAGELLLSMYPIDPLLEIGSNRDIYINCSWHKNSESEIILVNTVFKIVKQLGCRLVEDFPNPENFRANHEVRNTISSCGGLIAIFPEGHAEKPSRQIFKELEIANTLGLPYMIVAGNTVEIPEIFTQKAVEIVRINQNDIQDQINLTSLLHLAISNLKRQWKAPPTPQYVFYGTDLKDEHKERNQLMCRLIQRISAMPCLMGEGIRHGHVQQEITKRVAGAFMMIADVSNENLNTCIEAGVAMGAKVPLHLLAGGARRKPPFMFRDQQIWHYADDMELLGIIHNLVLPYRRNIINYESQNE